MPRNTSVSIGDHFIEFIEAKVAEGRYASTSDAIRAGLRLLEREEAQFDALKLALETGDTSGFALPFDVDAFLAERKAERE